MALEAAWAVAMVAATAVDLRTYGPGLGKSALPFPPPGGLPGSVPIGGCIVTDLKDVLAGADDETLRELFRCAEPYLPTQFTSACRRFPGERQVRR